MANPIISIVIPVYNGEGYLASTLDSILCQQFDDFEVIVINDCSRDGSQLIIDGFRNRDSRIIALNTDANLGIVPKVLSFALPHVRGDYFVYASQDDLFSADWLGHMYAKALCTGADAILPDMAFFHENNSSDRKWVGLRGNRDVVLTNREALALALDWTIHGFVLWRTRIVREIGFSDFGMYADDYSIKRFFFACNKVAFSEGTFYYRQDNPNAITKKVSYKMFDQPFNYFKIYEFLSENEFPAEICEKELDKAVIDLIGYAMKLRSLKKAQSSEFVVEAEKRVRQCFDVLSERKTLTVIRRRNRGVKAKIRCLALGGSYSTFGLWCGVFSFFSALKNHGESAATFVVPEARA